MDYYAVLGVAPNAHQRSLRKAYLKRPDKQLPEDAAAADSGLHKKRRTADGHLKEEIARARVAEAKQNSSARMLKVSCATGLAYSVEKLQEIFEHFGKVEAVVLEEERSALVLMSSETAAILATRGLGVLGNSGALQVVPMASPNRRRRASRHRAPRRKEVWVPARASELC